MYLAVPGLLVICFFIVSLLGYLLKPFLKGKTGMEMLAFSILLVLTGFVFIYIDLTQHSIFLCVIGLFIVLMGFSIGVISFLFK